MAIPLYLEACLLASSTSFLWADEFPACCTKLRLEVPKVFCCCLVFLRPGNFQLKSSDLLHQRRHGMNWKSNTKYTIEPLQGNSAAVRKGGESTTRTKLRPALTTR
mmetsp:Transcript_9995/g.26520  ORF Transcript_9995/g.26520 Transcript_9995/m.26520 type:complete len:106 (-) Transcript_9995:35-352(-)